MRSASRKAQPLYQYELTFSDRIFYSCPRAHWRWEEKGNYCLRVCVISRKKCKKYIVGLLKTWCSTLQSLRFMTKRLVARFASPSRMSWNLHILSFLLEHLQLACQNQVRTELFEGRITFKISKRCKQVYACHNNFIQVIFFLICNVIRNAVPL